MYYIAITMNYTYNQLGNPNNQIGELYDSLNFPFLSRGQEAITIKESQYLTPHIPQPTYQSPLLF